MSSLPLPTSTLAAALCTAHKDAAIPPEVLQHHEHYTSANQFCSLIIQPVSASVSAVWSVLRRFDQPQSYKPFIKSCQIISGSGGIGTVRENHIIPGLSATFSHERLEAFDEENHVLSFSVIGGEHQLKHYKSITSVHQNEDGKTVIVESYVADVPPGKEKEDIMNFVDTIVKRNLQSLAHVAEEVEGKGPGSQ